MKTSEFIRRLEDKDYKVYDRVAVLAVVHNNEIDVSVVISKKDQFDICSYGTHNKVDEHIFEICCEYASTPIEERKEEKKYKLALPQTYSEDYNSLTVLYEDDDDFYFSIEENDIIGSCIFTNFEIKDLPHQNFIKSLDKIEVDSN